MQTKKCTKCKKEKTIDKFSKEKAGKYGVRGDCKSCNSIKHKKWREDNSEYEKERQKKWRDENPDYSAEWERNNKERRKEKRRLLFEKHPEKRVIANLRTRIYHSLVGRKCSMMNLVGCSAKELREHLESQFTEGMTWDNYGEWHVDHIRPCASFDLSCVEQQRECFHYTNLQPLWAKDNLSKGSK